MHILQSRRDFLTTVSAAGAVSALGVRTPLADEPPPEITTVRLPRDPSICIVPEQIVDGLLRTEGFTDVRYVQVPHSGEAVVHGEVDFGSETAAWVVTYLDANPPITALAGIHVGCYELFAHEPVRTISDLKGRRVGIPQQPGSSGHLMLSLMAAQVGLDPQTDINWIVKANGDFMETFIQGEVDAFLAFPPEPQELRARGIGRVILATATDRPWSQYFCCIEFGNRDFVAAHPVATKRYLRALLKAADLCAAQPELAARRLVDAGFTGRYDYALQTLNELPYDRWREFDTEDSLRFFALRLHEVGMIRSSPNALLAEGTDWRFVNELKRELKA
jgi:NitT/TauT family transport system substrate-binding protein